MKRVFVLLSFVFCLVGAEGAAVVADDEKVEKDAGAQVVARPDDERDRQPKFSPDEFRRKQEAFIIEHAGLSEEEKKTVIPLLFEMKEKKREIDKQIGDLYSGCENSNFNEQTCTVALKKINNLKTQEQRMEKVYQQKLLKLISAAKLMRIMLADSNFDRAMLKEMFMQKRMDEKQGGQPGVERRDERQPKR